ncbi:dihydroxyacetone kinase subunit DhaK [Roseococcus sp. SDR]|uniref:dihydroxyacetone kinase family protein n=1 Tax=Roseococcus sp. SDR TaxID=2835532 RepID=UPI001BCBCB52|nr:dihydroxyacetone kinase family protein [Roseococcus sp. SDR]MBS7792666.1 dihydroxyacetone kinase subunit DhaK [Roseococcus sp. SDR]MBV1847980.1 dihydroxyacetone kinase subunit DhaK [Roseococcus sp. SDR]
MKKLLNDPNRVVREMLEGLCDLHPGLALMANENVVIRADMPPMAARPVAILSGGGAGHEPAHAGYVGPGLLTGAISGEVFTSPSVDAVLAGIRATAGPAGAVLVVKNYTGDRLNFGLAAELARGEGIPVEVVVVADDVALHGTVPRDRRRGIAGTVLVHKVAGAAAAAGHGLAEVAALARAAAADLGSMGVALGSCTVPAAGRPGFEIGPAEIELGLGIHGEQGVERTALLPADELVERILGTILGDLGLKPGEKVALLVNGLGGTPPMELAIVARRALALLRERGLVVERAWAGEFLTALEMPGVSLSLLRLDAARLALLDQPAEAPAWPGGGIIGTGRRIVPVTASSGRAAELPPGPLAPALRRAALTVAAALEAAEPRLTDLDSQAGDGDLGISLRRGARALRELPEGAWAEPSVALTAMAGALRRAIAGSSGPFYATALLRAARALPASPTPSDWVEAFRQGVEAITELGGARPGDRTMVDALSPAAEAMAHAARRGATLAAAVRSAADAAEAGAAATATMTPRLGRASYMGARAQGTPDGGAIAVSIWLRALAEGQP